MLDEVTFTIEYTTNAKEMAERTADAAWNHSLCKFFVRLITNFLVPLTTVCNAHKLVWYDCKPENIIVV